MPLNHAPKVFVSHASEDKQRFVLPFAERLRAKGIDAWVDRWEMLPGDSLVDKIFDEGLKEAAAVIIVLSTHSIQSRWVKEELNASVVARITRGTKVIPVLIDDVAVPEALKTTLWEKIADIDSYSESFDRIVAAIHGGTMKPALGPAPEYAQHPLTKIADLAWSDNLVLKLSCESTIAKGDPIVDPNEIFAPDRNLDLPHSEISDSIEVLDRRGYVDATWHSGSSESRINCFYRVTTLGMDAYARSYIADYDRLVSDVVALMINEKLDSSREIQSRLNLPTRLIGHVLELLALRGLINIETFLDGGILIFGVSAELRRSLR